MQSETLGDQKQVCLPNKNAAINIHQLQQTLIESKNLSSNYAIGCSAFPGRCIKS